MPRGKFKRADEAEWRRREAVVRRVDAGELAQKDAAAELGVSATMVGKWRSELADAGALRRGKRGRPKDTPITAEELQAVREVATAYRKAMQKRQAFPPETLQERIKLRPTETELRDLVSQKLGRKISHARARRAGATIGLRTRPDPVPEHGEPPTGLGLPPPGAGDAMAEEDDDLLPVTVDEYRAAVEEARSRLDETPPKPGRRTGKYAKGGRRRR